MKTITVLTWVVLLITIASTVLSYLKLKQKTEVNSQFIQQQLSETDIYISQASEELGDLKIYFETENPDSTQQIIAFNHALKSVKGNLSKVRPLNEEQQVLMEVADQQIEELSQAIPTTTSDTGEAEELPKKIEQVQEQITELKAAEEKLGQEAEQMVIYTFGAKVLFTLIFLLAALYVILSNKYDDDTKKWAFSVLSLISGFWIGTAT